MGFGSIVVVTAWVGTSLVFGLYLTSIADYGSIFGALATVVVALTYLYLASSAVLVGAQVDALVRERVRNGGRGRYRRGMTSPAAELMQRLGLSDDELCEVLDVDPLAVITGELDHRPELAILLALTAEATERVGPQTLRSWVRRRGPNGIPLEHLRARDFAAFEDDLAVLAERGYVLRSS